MRHPIDPTPRPAVEGFCARWEAVWFRSPSQRWRPMAHAWRPAWRKTAALPAQGPARNPPLGCRVVFSMGSVRLQAAAADGVRNKIPFTWMENVDPTSPTARLMKSGCPIQTVGQ